MSCKSCGEYKSEIRIQTEMGNNFFEDILRAKGIEGSRIDGFSWTRKFVLNLDKEEFCWDCFRKVSKWELSHVRCGVCQQIVKKKFITNDMLGSWGPDHQTFCGQYTSEFDGDKFVIDENKFKYENVLAICDSCVKTTMKNRELYFDGSHNWDWPLRIAGRIFANLNWGISPNKKALLHLKVTLQGIMDSVDKRLEAADV